jgi:hypothetical protein
MIVGVVVSVVVVVCFGERKEGRKKACMIPS